MLHTFILLPSIFLCLLIFFFLLFFFFSSHKATWSKIMAAAAHFGSCFSRNRPYRLVSMSILAGIDHIGMFQWSFWPYQFPFPPESARFGPNRRESGWVGANQKEKKKKKKRESWRVGRRMPRLATSDSDMATLEPCRCFLGCTWSAFGYLDGWHGWLAYYSTTSVEKFLVLLNLLDSLIEFALTINAVIWVDGLGGVLFFLERDFFFFFFCSVVVFVKQYDKDESKRPIIELW